MYNALQSYRGCGSWSPTYRVVVVLICNVNISIKTDPADKPHPDIGAVTRNRIFHQKVNQKYYLKTRVRAEQPGT